ncbi:MAG TPA: S41 family peptidase [Pyrinomonadaceae bacterium]|nr:S41 family peptidase [Pyrinomonadaceae bacterium]
MRQRIVMPGVLALLFALSLPAIIFSQSDRSARRQPATPEAASPTRPAVVRPATPTLIKGDIAEALAIIQESHIDGKKLDYNTVFKSSINGMLNALDPHSTYFDPIEYASFRTEQRSEYFGIGATIGDLRVGDQVDTFIRATFDGAPAARAGLRFGDRIVEVDGQSMRGKPYSEVRRFLLGPRGTVVKVTVETPANQERKTVTITRDAVPLPSIPQAYMLKPGVGYVAMTGGFNRTTADEFQEALRSLRSQGMNTLILDLRGNRGGLLIQAVRVANTFLQRGQLIVRQEGRIKGSSENFPAVNDAPDPTPLVVLVNGDSASAAEIVAGALQDHDRALIVGENTFGKGLVQLPIELEHDSALLLTIAKYFTPSGRLIQRDYSSAGFYDYYTNGGVAPDKKDAPTAQPNGPESRTDLGRAVYGGGGIAPDEVVKSALIGPAEARLIHSIFAFSLEIVTGRVPGFESYKVQKPIEYGHDLKGSDFEITDELFNEMKRFVAGKPAFNVTAEQLDRARAFVSTRLRYELATAAYGTMAALQVFNEEDPQVLSAVEAMPRARELAQAAKRARASGSTQTPNPEPNRSVRKAGE